MTFSLCEGFKSYLGYKADNCER